MSILKANRIENLTTTDGGINVNNSGNVGIGTDSPARRFVVSGGSSEAVAQFTNDTSGDGQDDGFQILHFTSGLTRLLNRENGPTAFSTNNTERLRIDSSGNVGIGTSSPNQDLTVSSGADKLHLFGSTAGNGGALFASNSAYTDYEPLSLTGERITFSTRTGTFTSSERLRIDSSGNVGVGTSSPSSKLDLAGSRSTSANNTITDATFRTRSTSGGLENFAIRHRGSSSGISGLSYVSQLIDSGSNGMEIYTAGSAPIVLGTSASERVRIDSSGNLTLKTTSSAGKFIFQEGSSNAWSIDTNGANGYLRFYDEYNSSERLRIDSSGNVGIGTPSPEKRLHVHNASADCSIRIKSDTSYAQLQLIGADGLNYITSDDPVSFYVNSSERMRIDSSGRVGIGETSPDAPLHIRDSRDEGNGSTYPIVQFSRRNGGSNDAILHAVHDGSDGIKALRLDLLGSERLRFTNNGLTFNGDTAAANAFDDYEEGTFTPTLALTSPGNSSISYSNQTGRYVKVGKIVYFSIDVRLTSFSRGTGTGSFQIQGLPVVPVNTANYARSNGFANLYNWDYTSTSNQIPTYSVLQDGSTTAIDLILHREANTSTSDIGNPGSTSMVFISGTYEANS